MCLHHLPILTRFPGAWEHCLMCAVCLLWGADVRLWPSWKMSTIHDPRKTWLETGGLLTVWWRMLVSGAEIGAVPCLPALAVTCLPLRLQQGGLYTAGVVDLGFWATSPLAVVVGRLLCGLFFFSPSQLSSLWDFKYPHRPAFEGVSYCLYTSSPSRLPPHDGSLSLTLLFLFLSFIFCPTSFWREWAAFLGAWCPPPAFRSCFVEVAQHSNNLLMNLCGRKWSPCPIPPPSSKTIF